MTRQRRSRTASQKGDRTFQYAQPPASDGARMRALELALLDQIKGGDHVSQRTLADALGLVPSRVNRILRRLREGGLVRIANHRVRPFAYRLTKKGEAYRKRLVHERFDRVAGRIREMKAHIERRIADLVSRGIQRVVCYGSGEVLEVVAPIARAAGMTILGAVDDDPAKQGTRRAGMLVRAPSAIAALNPDAVLITTFRHAGQIKRRLQAEGVRGVEL